MNNPEEPRYKPFGNQPFEELDRRQLEELAAKQRRDPPKIRKVIDALDAAGTDFVSDLPKNVRDELKGEFGLGPFASFGSIARATRKAPHPSDAEPENEPVGDESEEPPDSDDEDGD